ncbi:hypothetical protein KY290_005063 [Solanum tuberosum]|uniref:alcohol dehydrogenase n=1 Tax=Solanum tuberosum TaxID=4113 RepID=A0ABQ7WEE0_SOLTU|nr:hypothetical protein KY289_005425 [Solanum tuberosum]KAH0751817.1 hypothetical protein KY285_004965 [Solanum tuberosum]KAH0778636.1 hypothetical protein KY290_005063 [Solanum tuberosum]
MLADLSKVIAEMTDHGVDRSVECTGHIDAMIPAFECVHDGWGVAVLVGVPHKEALFKTYSMNFLNERTLKETFFGNYKPSSDIPSVKAFVTISPWRAKLVVLEKDLLAVAIVFVQVNLHVGCVIFSEQWWLFRKATLASSTKLEALGVLS